MMARRGWLVALAAALLVSCGRNSTESQTAPPVPASWTTVAVESEPTARHEAAMVALGDKAYLMGGRGVKPVEEFAPQARTWRQLGPTPLEMHHFQPVAYGDEIYVMTAMTGKYPKETPLETVYVYSPSTDTWTQGPSIPPDRRRGGAGTVAYDGKIYVACGIVDGHTSGTVRWFDEFDPQTGEWRILPDAPRARDHFSAVASGDRLYLVGGRNTSYHEPDNFTAFFSAVIPEVDVYDFSSGEWSTLPAELPVPTAAGGLVAVGGSIYYFGGETAQDLAHSETQRLDIQTGKWSLTEPLQRGRHGGGAAVLDGTVYFAAGSGGRGGGPELSSTEMLLPLGTPAADRPAAPNPYADGQQWGTFPTDRTWGSTSAIAPHRNSDGELTGMIWVAERCSGSNCRESSLDPVLLFDSGGSLVRSFGSGLFIWPHGIHADHEGNVWVTDAVHTDCKTGAENGKGHQVFKFAPTGEVLLTLGTAGVPGESEDSFSCPSDVVTSRDGSIFVGDGHNHGHGGNNRIVKFTKDGKFVTSWGTPGSGPGEFRGIHALAMDSQDRLFVGDRANQRIQVFDAEGAHLDTWTQFGSPSGIHIDSQDTIYVADSDSGYDPEGSGDPRNPGFARGIYVGDARTGSVEAFIPDPLPDLSRVTSGAEGVAVVGNAVFGAQVGGSRGVLKYSPKP